MAPLLTPIMVLTLSFLGFVLLLVIATLSFKLHKKVTRRRKTCSASDYAAGSARTTLTEFPNDLIIRVSRTFGEMIEHLILPLGRNTL